MIEEWLQGIRSPDPSGYEIRRIIRRDTHHGESLTADVDDLADDLWIGSEEIFPDMFAEYDDLHGCSRLAFIREKKAPPQRPLDAEHLEVIAGDKERIAPLVHIVECDSHEFPGSD